MEIFIVASGIYEDFKIRGMFQHKDVAEQFRDLIQQQEPMEEVEIIPWKTLDNIKIEPLYYIRAYYFKFKSTNEERVTVRAFQTTTIDYIVEKGFNVDIDKEITKTSYTDEQYTWSLHIGRRISLEEFKDRQEVEKYYGAFAKYLARHVQNLKSKQGFDEERILKWLENNLKTLEDLFMKSVMSVRDLVKNSKSPLITPDLSHLELEMISRMPEEQRKEYIRISTGIDKLEELFQEIFSEDKAGK
jgi:hypothetical protein